MVNTRLEVALRALDGERLEQLAVDLLRNDDDFVVRPTDTRGPDGGREANLKDGDLVGILHCSVEDGWERKAKSDAGKAAERDADFFYFVTNQDPAGVMRDRVDAEIEQEHGYRTRIIDFAELRNALLGNRDNHYLAREHLSVDPSTAFENPEGQADDFQQELLERIEQREAPYGSIWNEFPLVIVHLIPAEATEPVHDRIAEDLPNPPAFAGKSKFTDRLGDMLIVGTNAPEGAPTRWEMDKRLWETYACFHSDGWIEAVTDRLSHRDGSSTISYWFDPTIVEFVRSAIDWLNDASIHPPYYVYISLLDASDWTFAKPDNVSGPYMTRRFGDDLFTLPRTTVDEPDPDVPQLLRKPLYMAWERAGWTEAGSIHYQETENESGEIQYAWDPFTSRAHWLSGS